MNLQAYIESLRGDISHSARVLFNRINQNRARCVCYLLVALLGALLASQLLGDNFDAANQRQRGEPTYKVRRASGGGGSGDGSNQLRANQQVDPFASRPRIETRNGHLILQASQDKNIDFKTSGSRGTITVNGYKLDQLIGVARALEKSSAGRLLSDGNSSSPLGPGPVQDQIELVLRGLFESAGKLARLAERADALQAGLGELRDSTKKWTDRLAKRSKRLSKLQKQFDQVVKKLKENNCLDPDSGQPVCKNGASCIDLYDSYKCLCPNEWEGQNCDMDADECQKLRGTELGCQNGGKCINYPGGYRCECSARFHGVHCTEQHDDCSLASSSSMCGHGKCVNLARTQANQPSYECICDQGWTSDGKSPACVVDINECLAGQALVAPNITMDTQLAAAASSSPYPCSQNPFVECVNLPGSFQCGPCPAGYQGNGRVCRDIDECRDNNGGCSRSPLVECTNTPGGRKCGPCPPGYRSYDDSATCLWSPACQQDANGGCHPRAKCINLGGVANADASRLCVCEYPFVGSGVGPSGCMPMSSGVGGGSSGLMPPYPSGGEGNSSSAVGGGGLFGLTDPLTGQQITPNFTIQFQPQDDCQPSPCLNGGQCVYGDGTFECICPVAWTGRLCDERAADSLSCGGRLQTSQGVFEFPVGGTFERLIKLAQTKLDSGKLRLGGPAGDWQEPAKSSGSSSSSAGAAAQSRQYRCTWSIVVAGNMSIRLEFSRLASRASTQPAKRVQAHVFNSTTSSISPFKHPSQAPPSCQEYLDVRERLDHALELAGAQGRLLARLCMVSMSAGSSLTAGKNINGTRRDEGVTLVSESNMVDLEYLFVASARAAQLTEPSMSFQLNWSRSEPACGGELPVMESGSISSPRFPEFYPAGTECRYLLRVAPGKRIRIQFGELNLLSSRPQSDVCADSLAILDGALGADRPVLFKHCANQAPNHQSASGLRASALRAPMQPLISSSSAVEVVLISRPESSTPLMRPKQKRGFYLTYASESSEPGCGGLYTTKSALIKSLDFETSAESAASDPALAYESARYFDVRDSSSSSSSSSSSAASSFNMSGSAPSRSFTPGQRDSTQYRTRCEYEIRPADQTRNQRVQLDWLEMPSDLSSDSTSSLSEWSRRWRCSKSSLMIFSGKPTSSSDGGGGGGGASDNVPADRLLATFCAGDRYSSSMAQLKPIASSGHLLYLVYESQGADQNAAHDSAAAGAAGGSGGQAAASAPTTRARFAGGFRLHYSTVCSAVYRQLDGQIQTELGPDVDECLYHLILPANNTISLLIEPMISVQSATGSRQETTNLASLTLPDGSCGAQAIFMDGAVPRGPLGLGQTERQLRTYDFSGATFGAGSSDSSAEVGSGGGGAFTFASDHAPESQPSTRTSPGMAAFGLADAGDDSPASQASTGSQIGSGAKSAPAGTRNSYWQYGSSQAHDIKEFDVCNLPAIGIDSIWNEMSLMFRLNPKLKASLRAKPDQQQQQQQQQQELKFVIKYQSSPSCGGIIQEPRTGSIELVSSRPVDSLKAYPMTVGRYEQLHRMLFVNQCAWILRNPRMNEPIQVSFEQVPREEIVERRRAWIEWLRETKAASNNRPGNSKATLTTTTTPTPPRDDPEDAPSPGEAEAQQRQQQQQIANCSQAFQELIELYEPATGRSRLICPTELVEQTTVPQWTTMSDTLYVRLINDTTPTDNNSTATTTPSWPGRKPLRGFPIKFNYVLLAPRQDRATCGGKLLQSSGTIQSPRFPFNYPANAACVWLIQAPSAEQQIRLNFSKFHLEEQHECWFDYLEIRNGPTESSPLMGSFCNRQLQSRVLISQSSYVWLKFRSDAHLSRPGFQLHFDTAQTGCGGLLTGPSGQIDSPNYPFSYAHGADCEWTIQVSESNRISLRVEDLDLSGTQTALDDENSTNNNRLSSSDESSGTHSESARSGCQLTGPKADYLEIFDFRESAAGGQAQSLGRWCHLSHLSGAQQRAIESSSNRLRIVYRSQAQDVGRGFRLTYKTNCTYGVELAGTSGVIESPGYPSDSSLQACTWVVRAPLGSNLTVALVDYEGSTSTTDSLWSWAGLMSSLNSSARTTTPAPARGTSAKSKRPAEGEQKQQQKAPSDRCPTGDLMQLRFWSARVVNSSVPIQKRLEPIDSRLVKMLERKQISQIYSSTSYYNFSLLKSLCPAAAASVQSEQEAAEQRPSERSLTFEVPSNVLIVNHAVQALQGRGRRFRIEWRARGCGGQQVVSSVQRMIEGIRFDERLNLTRAQAGQPIECFWLIDATRMGRMVEFDLSSDMLVPSSVSTAITTSTSTNDPAETAACEEASLTMYDGSSEKAPVLYKNCRLSRKHETIFATSGQLLVRYFSSGQHTTRGSSGRSFTLAGWASHRDGCSQSVFDLNTPFLEAAGSRTSPKYPDLYEAQAYRCSSLISSLASGRLRFTIDELDIPPEPDPAGASSLNSALGLLDPNECKKSGNYLQIRAGLTSEPKSDIFCGKIERSSGLGLSSPESLARSTFILEQPTAWLEFHSKGDSRGRWKVSYDRLCGSSLMSLNSAEEFSTPNYPGRPQWPSGSAATRHTTEHVCIWRLNFQEPSWAPASTSRGRTDRLHFSLMDFVESDEQSAALRGQDCLRLYEGYNISLRQSTFNLTDMDAKLEPKLRICSKADLRHNSMYFVSRGSELVIMTSGRMAAKFRVRPFENHCGGDLLLGAAEFATPNYPQPYGPDLDCHYFIAGSPGSRVNLRFDAFDLAEPADSALQTGADAGAKCDTSDYVELRQLSSRQRVQVKLRGLLARRWAAWTADSSKATAFNIDDFLAARGQRSEQLGPPATTTTTTTPKARNSTDTNLRARRKSLSRLLELAHLFNLFEESPASSAHHLVPRVRGQNSRLSIKLEDFYASSTLIGRFCGKQAPKIAPALLQDEILVRFRSHGRDPSETQQPRGFLASYKLEYGGPISVAEAGASTVATDQTSTASASASSWGFISSPSFPAQLLYNSTITWTFETQLDAVLEFELISLTLGPIHQDCQDTLSLYDGLQPSSGSPRLARLCGHLSFKRLLDSSMLGLWLSALEGSLSTRRLPVNLAHEPEVQANLLRRIRTSSNVATLVYDNLSNEGAFLIRYKMVKKSELASRANESAMEDPLERPLGADEALADQFAGPSLEPADQVAGPGDSQASRSCSRIFRLALSSSWSGSGGSPNASDDVQLASPDWPNEVRDKEVECHWLLTTNDNTNIDLQIDPTTSMASNSEAALGQLYSRGAGQSNADFCFRPAGSVRSMERNFVVFYDGASKLAPVLARYCLPAPPVQLRSTGRHLFVRYVHAQPPELGALSTSGSKPTDEQPDADQPSWPRTSLFRAHAQVGRCGGQYHVLYQANIRDRPKEQEGPGARRTSATYENNLNCLYYVFASNPDQVLTIHGQLSEIKLASTPTNADCSLGDHIEIRDLPLQSDRFEPLPGSDSSTGGRLLGRFCARHELDGLLESPGSAIVIQFKTDGQNVGQGFNLMVSSGHSQVTCPRSSLTLNPDEPYARLLSPNWPHGFSGKRRCKYHVVAPRNQSLELTFVRLRRPSESESGTRCVDSFAYLDDNEAASVRYDFRPLRELRAPISGTQLRQLVKQVPCARQTAYADYHSPQVVTNSSAGEGATKWGSFFGKISSDEYRRLVGAAPTSGLYSIQTNSHQLLLEYSAKNLLPGEGFLAVVRLVDLPSERLCGGDIYARPGANLLESPNFGRLTNDSSDHYQCDWQLKFSSSASHDYFTDSNYFLSGSKSAAWFNLDLAANSSGAAAATAAREFKTSSLVFQVLEIPPLVQNTTLVEEQYGTYLESRNSELCGLNRLLLTDGHFYNGLMACGYLTNARQLPKWTLVDEQTLSQVMLRTKNLERVVYDTWPEATTGQAQGSGGGGASNLEGRTKLFRGMRAYFYESSCPRAERLPGETVRIQSHSGFLPAGSNSSPSATPLSYQPAICKWMIRLKSGHYEIKLKSLNLRRTGKLKTPSDKPQLSCNSDNPDELDYLELRASSELDAPVLARYCANNQLEAQKHSLAINTSVELTVLFVAGLKQLRQGSDSFPAEVDPVRPLAAYGFDLQLTRVMNSSISEFCRRDSSYNIFQLIRNRERTKYYGSDYYSSTISPSSLYPKNTHCVVDLSVDDGFRFNLTFTSFFDLEPSSKCQSGDYIEINDLVESRPQAEQLKQKTTSRRPSNAKKPTQAATTTTTTKKPGNDTTTSRGTKKNPSEIYEKISLNLFYDLEPKVIGRWCGRTIPKGNFLSSSNKIRLVFHSNERIEGKGFILEWSAVGDGTEITTNNNTDDD